MSNANQDEDYDDNYGILGRMHGVAFVVPVGGDLRGHIVGGVESPGSTCWEYEHGDFADPVDLWVQRTSFYNNNNRQNREGMISFSFPELGRAFVGLGKQGQQPYDDLWEFIPLIDDYTYDDGQ
jgi:hypothetical protein